MKLEELHDCEKCHGKIVCITADNMGVTRCGYCGEVVDYKPYMKQELKKWKKKNPDVFSDLKETENTSKKK